MDPHVFVGSSPIVYAQLPSFMYRLIQAPWARWDEPIRTTGRTLLTLLLVNVSCDFWFDFHWKCFYSCICLFMLFVFVVVTMFMLFSWPGNSWNLISNLKYSIASMSILEKHNAVTWLFLVEIKPSSGTIRVLPYLLWLAPSLWGLRMTAFKTCHENAMFFIPVDTQVMADSRRSHASFLPVLPPLQIASHTPINNKSNISTSLCKSLRIQSHVHRCHFHACLFRFAAL